MCPRCDRPLVSVCLSSMQNLEVGDAQWFTPHCHCGWTGDVAEVTAVQHWVTPWEASAPVGIGVPGSCDESAV